MIQSKKRNDFQILSEQILILPEVVAWAMSDKVVRVTHIIYGHYMGTWDGDRFSDGETGWVTYGENGWVNFGQMGKTDGETGWAILTTLNSRW